LVTTIADASNEHDELAMLNAAARRLKRILVNQGCRAYRSALLRRPTFIAITGSCGKTTTKEFVHAILSQSMPGQKSPGNCNTAWHIPRIITSVRRNDRFCVVEVGADGRGALDGPLEVFRPRIGVVTNIGMDHYSHFRSVDAIATEKRKLVEALPAEGVAVLNADDPRVMAMASHCAGRVVTYGLSAEAAFRAKDVSSDWPKRLSLTACYEGREIRVQTQLLGTHWAPLVLAALAVAHEMGVPLESATAAVSEVPPFMARMSPVTMDYGVTFIRDDAKAPMWTIPSSLEVMRCARAKRKIAVIGTISDYTGNPPSRYRECAKQALDAVDYVFFVGRHANKVITAKTSAAGDRLQAFVNTAQLRRHLCEFLQPDDLVLLKGSDKVDHLGSIVTAARGTPEVLAAEVSGGSAQSEKAKSESLTAAWGSAPPDVFLVGLGNPERRHQGTPHNVGQEVIDLLAAQHGARWIEDGPMLVADIEFRGPRLLLVKVRTAVNDTGAALAAWARDADAFAQRAIVIFDDMDLALGAVRQKQKGSAGGHRGVQSLINALETEDFRRIKIGVGRPPAGVSVVDYVLTPFGAEQRPIINDACRKAAAIALEVIWTQRRNVTGASNL